ncbi:MAG: hypothetical protein HWE15_04450 [Algoriphagus sp.]|uniref:hypothetical protein n=1 Tax=Algoriphagus sp. TaxID=1872435 RepID=UPI00178E291D|nr:hypothetical protein [Algoriphagus sp.]NVJ85530.1 hypothetical protein [Algoriphagus sp.]
MLRFCFSVFLLAYSIASFAQTTYSGNILDSQDKGFLEDVSVISLQNNEEVLTNSRGYFSLKSIPGDTLLITFPGFISQRIVLEEERFITIELQDKARFLPTFEVRDNSYSYRFKDGRLVLRENDEAALPSRKGEAIAGTLPEGGMAFSGVISYFTKKARLAREYEKKKVWHSRREGYYKIIESDSIRSGLMEKYRIGPARWDELVIQFNQFHQSHEFLDWTEAKVMKSLEEFVEIESSFLN